MQPTNSTLEFLLTYEFERLFHAWDAAQPARTGMHASSVLEPDSDFCTRQHVLADAFPAERQTKDLYLPALQKFLHGWQIHEKWQQKLLKPSGMVVRKDEDVQPIIPAYELDMTHIHAETGISYSPDAIITFAGLTLPVEIKGINHNDYAGREELYRQKTVEIAQDQYAITYEKVQDKRLGVVGATLAQAMTRSKSIRQAVPQLNLYMHLLGLTEPPNNRGIVLVEDKNDQNFTLWVHTYDPEMSEEPLQRAQSVRTAKEHFDFNDGDLPSRICSTSNDPRAKRCPFADACFNRENSGGE